MLTTLVGLIAFGSPDTFVINPRVFESEFKATYQYFNTMTIPATVTKSMGLPADAPLSWFLHCHLPIYCTVSNSRRLSGLSHLDHLS
jgi:hypothetical protein